MPVDTVESLAKEIDQAVESMDFEKITEEKETEETSTEETSTNETITDKTLEPTEEDTTETTEEETAGTEEETEEVIEEVIEEAPAPAVISDDTLTRAVEVGFLLADARAFQSEAALERNIAVVERASEIRREQLGEEEEAPADPFADLPKLDPENYDPEVIKMFDAMKGELVQQRERLQGFEDQQTETSQVAQQAVAQEIEQWFDKQVEGLGEDFSGALGTGSHAAMDRGSSQFTAREEIADQIGVLHAGYEAQGKKAPARDQLFKSAARMVLMDRYQELHDEKLSGKLEKQSSQHLQRAGGKKATATLSPEEEAAQAIDDKYGV